MVDGPTFFNWIRILLHDRGEGYLVPHPRWGDNEIAVKAMACRDVLFATIIEAAEKKSKIDRSVFYSPICCNNLVKTCNATSGQPAPPDLFRLLMGWLGTQGEDSYRYILPLGVALGGAMPDRYSVWIAAGIFQGYATNCVYYARPTSVISPTAQAFGDFSDGFYSALVTHTCIELVMGEPQDAADRLDDLNDLLSSQMEGLV